MVMIYDLEILYPLAEFLGELFCHTSNSRLLRCARTFLN